MSSDVAPRLDSVYVEQTVGRLESRIRARFPDRRLGDAAIVESAVNDLVFTGIAVYFLWAMPERLERRTLLDLLHRLRSLAHVVDMHLLDKDPEQAREDYHPTAQSPPRRIMDAEALHHYLDYCSELVALIAKTAALCAERTSDPVVLGTVSEIETVTAHMSQKIWQKISLLPDHG